MNIENRILDQASSTYFATRFYRALFELDMLEEACIAEMDVCYVTVEMYKDEKGQKFHRAQRAALKNDKLMTMRAEIQRRRDVLLENFIKVWTVYCGGERLYGRIIADYIATQGNIAKMEEKFDAKEIKKALKTWGTYVTAMEEIAAEREEEITAENYSEKEAWWKRY